MRRLLFCVLLAITASAPLLRAEDATQDPKAALASLADLSRRGQLPQLIDTANSLLSTNKLAPTDQAMALVYLGYAYQQRGEFTKATANYGKALTIVDRDGQHSSEYAATLATLATVYSQIGQIDTAKHILIRAVGMFESENDHAGAAMVWNDLATIAAEHNSRSDAHKFMERSIAESKLANNMASGELASITTSEGRISELDGNPRIAISDYQHALELWKQTGKDQQPREAWLDVLLGNAYLQAGDTVNALASTKRGLAMLEATSGRQTVRYLAAELVYSKVLDATGAHDQAATLRKEAQSGMNTSTDRQRAQSQISVSALR